MCMLKDWQSWVIGVLMLGMNDKLENKHVVTWRKINLVPSTTHYARENKPPLVSLGKLICIHVYTYICNNARSQPEYKVVIQSESSLDMLP